MLAKRKVSDDVSGVGRLHAMVAELVEEPSEVVVGIETDRGLLVGSLVQAGIASTRSTRWRPRDTGTATPSPGLSPTRETPRCWPTSCAPTARTIRSLAGDTELAEAVKVLARAHQPDLVTPATGERAQEHAA